MRYEHTPSTHAFDNVEALELVTGVATDVRAPSLLIHDVLTLLLIRHP